MVAALTAVPFAAIAAAAAANPALRGPYFFVLAVKATIARGAVTEHEKFLFYRGLGAFALPLEVRSQGGDDDATLTLRNRSSHPLRGLFVIHVGKGSFQVARLDDLPGATTVEVKLANRFPWSVPLEEGVPAAKKELIDVLVQSGLYKKEAGAMVNTWESSYLRSTGLRLLYIVPRANLDAALPIQITPEPKELVRTMVGRVEVLTPKAEKAIENAIAELDGPNSKDAVDVLRRLGRLREPVLHRIEMLSTSTKVVAKAKQLIQRAETGNERLTEGKD
jgi:hypothetical protein